MRLRINHYFSIVLRNTKDSVPKAIGHFLVNKSIEEMQSELYDQVDRNEQLLQTIGEPKRVTERRKALMEQKRTLEESINVLQRNRE